jgi:hypothetical protein
MADGALRSDVLAALKQHGCAIYELADGRCRVGLRDYIEVLVLSPVVSRSVCAHLNRRFGVPLPQFFPPRRET